MNSGTGPKSTPYTNGKAYWLIVVEGSKAVNVGVRARQGVGLQSQKEGLLLEGQGVNPATIPAVLLIFDIRASRMLTFLSYLLESHWFAKITITLPATSVRWLVGVVYVLYRTQSLFYVPCPNLGYARAATLWNSTASRRW